jgi:hypothetical protein
MLLTEKNSTSTTVTPPLFKRERIHGGQREKEATLRPIAASVRVSVQRSLRVYEEIYTGWREPGEKEPWNTPS